jgi:hypothetical protein
MVSWAQTLLAQILSPGDLAVDLTAGTGRDTLSLWRRVAPDGQVLAFDLQDIALRQTGQLLVTAGAPVHAVAEGVGVDRSAPGIHLIPGCHSRLTGLLPRAPRAAIANLGYLPGGKPEIVTRPATTLAALDQVAEALTGGGRLAVTVYPGHPGGTEESAAVSAWFAALPPRTWDVLSLEVRNRGRVPFVLVAEKRGPSQPENGAGR